MVPSVSIKRILHGWKWAHLNNFYCSNRVTRTIRNDSRISLHEVESEKCIVHATGRKIFVYRVKTFSYVSHMSTGLREDHVRSRLCFSRYCRKQLRNDINNLERIFFSDECKFSLSWAVNKQNCRTCGTQRPNKVYETLFNSPYVLDWCAVSKNEVMGPYCFENENVTGSTYKRMLGYFLFPRRRGYYDHMFLYNNGAPSHYSLEVRENLNRKLRNRWMEGGGLIECPSRSPDISP